MILAAAAALAGYLCGSIPFGVIVSRLANKPDPRTVGSGNIGATNVMRASGKRLGLAVLLLDALKGFGPAFLAARWTHSADPVALAAGFSALVGHCYPVWLRGRGGKGVATGLGVGLALAPYPTAAGLAAFAVVVAPTRVVSLGSLAGVLAALAMAFYLGPPALAVMFAAMSALIVWRHRGNLARLWRREERRV